MIIKGRGRCWILFIAFCVLSILVSPMVMADDTSSQAGLPAGQNEYADEKDETMFYAFLEEDNSQAHGPLYEFFRSRQSVRVLLGPDSRVERRSRPMMQWRRWADRRQRFTPALLFILGVSFLYWFILPGIMQTAAEECKKSFWKSFGSGLLLAIIAMSLLRSVLVTQFGWPFGILLAGVSQAAMLAGLSVAIYNMGHAVILLSGLRKLKVLSARPKVLRVCDILAGALLSALILQIPGIGMMPRCGTRLLALFALLGIGALCRVIKKRQSQPI